MWESISIEGAADDLQHRGGIVILAQQGRQHKRKQHIGTLFQGKGYDLILKGKNHYDEKSQTQFCPSIYELYHGAELLQSETMDFQTHLYQYGEMDEYLRGCGFKSISVYSNYQKEPAVNDQCEMFIYECGI